MKHPAFVTCLLSFVISAPFAMADTVEVAGRIWTLGSGATLDGTVATFHVDGVERRSSTATTEVDLSPFVEGGAVEWRIRARGLDIAKPEKGWLGLKAMLSFKDGTGAMKYPGPGSKTGTFGWYTLRYRTALTNGVSGTATFMVGLQETNGEASFDLASLQFFPYPLEWPDDDPDYQCEYSPHLAPSCGKAFQALPVPPNGGPEGGASLRGMMLPSRGLHDEDFAKLASWGVTLVRYQMNRNWNFADTERDLADYDAWMKVKLDHLEERVVPFAAKYGIKVVVDLHMPPGGRSADHEMNMFYEPEYADHYVETWRGIARRFKGAPSIVAYDLVNEPHQTYHAAEGNDCLSLQMRAAKAIREIDPDIPVIVEPIHNASPEGFKTLRALPMKNVIYQVHVYQPFAYTHQGINTAKPWEKGKWPDPEKGWDKDFLREKLAPVRDFQLRHGARIYVGEFSCIAWAEGAGNYLRDCIDLFEEYGWDWTFHAYDEFSGWSIEHEADVPFELRPSGDNPRMRALLDGFQRVQTPEGNLSPLEGLSWRLPSQYATLEGDRLVIDIPADAYPADAVAEAELPLSLFNGVSGFSMSVLAEGRALAKPTHSYLGLKFQFHVHQGSTGRDWWPNCANEIGDFPAKTLRNDIAFGGMEPDGSMTITLMLGLQGTSGHVEFDLSTLCSAPSEGLFRRINQDWKVRYPAGADGTAEGRAPLRGCMLPGRATTEDDIETLHQWGATLVRFQITRNWSAVDDNQDLDEYARWVDSRLANLENVVRWARERGMKIVIDLHALPGGRGKNREMAMFRDERYANAFVDTWRRIAARFKGNADVIYGYDLVNEPVQLGRAPIDYWTLQRRAAEAVREIDPDTAIIIESNGWDAPGTFAYLSPLRMHNIIYQVHCYAPIEFTHQGIHNNPIGPKWPDAKKNWTQDFLRNLLRPVREFEAQHGAKIYVGEFSAAAWAPGAENYLRDCIDLFEEYGWDWTYHAFREAKCWSVELEADKPFEFRPAEDTPRKRALLNGLRH